MTGSKMSGKGNIPSPAAKNCAAFSLAAAFLSGILLHPPGEEFLREIRERDLLEDWPILVRDPDTARGIELIKAAVLNDSPGRIQGLTDDFNRLFIGPGPASAPPYESLYVGREKVLFDRSTLQVREAYRRSGFRAREVNRMPDDHIGLELAFISRLCAPLPGREGRKDGSTLPALSRFLGGHTLRWVGTFCRLMAEGARTDFYRGAAFLLMGTLEALADLLGLPSLPGLDPQGVGRSES
jgi:TorA maturation chaperone TorD